ncbi:M14 family metallopeptidase [Flavobacteriaceae bacterium]|nr:M14 family metallopeptidase [Flavobacteriaceae bacterium]
MKNVIITLVLFAQTLGYGQLQSPSEFLGYTIGTQFTRHADVVDYFEHVAQHSDMVQYKAYGKTNERRTLTYAVVSSAQNIENAEQIRLENLKNAGIIKGEATPTKAIVWLSYNVHGNEASSTEAAMTTVYDLITKKQQWLENTIVIIDPCVNPDGRDRYTNWYNQVKSTPYNAIQDADEHNEPWPGGRPNHYLFDLNRDWAWATQVETQQRLKIYNKWMPHIHVDFHEQGINEPYYFAPAAEPFHEVISDFQRDFQTQIGKNHARYFDKEGWLFFTRERFDLLYPSYGDTYPTFMGAIGMTYEQAGHGRAGLGINTDEGYELTLVDRVAHHTTTGISTVEMGSKNAVVLNTEFKKFFTNDALTYKSYVLQGHPDKIGQLTQLLDKHEISYGYGGQGSVSGYHYTTAKKGSMSTSGALVVSTNQAKGKMIKVLFEPDAKLEEPLTYDITAWSIPYAYGLEAIASKTLVNATQSKTQNNIENTNTTAAGFIASWDTIKDARFLAALLQQNMKVRFTEKKLRFGGENFDRGSLVITKSDNKGNPNFYQELNKIANEHGRILFASKTTFGDTRTDMGSPDIKMINAPKIALLKGEGVSSLSYGSIWHFFEKQLHYPVTHIGTQSLSSRLARYNVLVLPEGRYNKLLGEQQIGDLKKWIANGGKVIAMGDATRSFLDKKGFDLKNNEQDQTEDSQSKTILTPYDQRESESVTNFITGSIYKITIDASHPLAFGYGDTYFSLKQGSTSYQFMEQGYNVGYIDGDATSVSGFSGEKAKEKLKNSMIFGEARMGSGSVVYLVDDVLFRSFWEQGKLFFANALFFVNNNKFTL